MPWPTIGICTSSADFVKGFFISSVPPLGAIGVLDAGNGFSDAVAEGTDGAAVPSALAPAIAEGGGESDFAEAGIVFAGSEQLDKFNTVIAATVAAHQ